MLYGDIPSGYSKRPLAGRGPGDVQFRSLRTDFDRYAATGNMPNPLDWTVRATVVLIIGLVLANHAGYFQREASLPTASVQHLDGREYLIPDVLRYFPVRGVADLIYSGHGDSNDRPPSSQVGLLENGRPLGPPHAAHQEIADQGNGRFSHWSDGLRFSSSDNSDPRSNGRLYSIVQRAETSRLIALPVLALLALIAWRQRRPSTEMLPEFRFAATALRSSLFWYGISVSVGLSIVGCYVFGAPPVPLIEPDSTSYWFGLDVVPIGYPLFLWTVYDAFGNLSGVAIVQILLFFAAVIAMQSGIARATGSAAAAGIAAVLIFVFGAATSTAIWMLSESTFISAVLLHVAAAGWAFARPTRLNLASLALTAVIALSIRPVGYFLFGGIIYLVFFWSGRRLMVLRWAMGPLIVFALTYYGLGMITRGQSGQTNLGASLFGHVVHLYDRAPPELPSTLTSQLDSTLIRNYRLLRAKTSDWLVLQDLEVQNFNFLLEDIYTRLDRRADKEFGVMLGASIFTIKNHPVGYMETVLQNVYAWFCSLIFYNEPDVKIRLAREYKRFWPEIEHYQRLFENKNTRITADEVQNNYYLTYAEAHIPIVPMPISLLIAIKIAFVGVAIIASITFVLGYGRPGTNFIAYVAALTVGGALLVALSTVFSPRYAIPLDPLVVIAAVVGAWQGLVFAAAGARRAAKACRHVVRAQVLEHLTPNGRLPHAVD